MRKIISTFLVVCIFFNMMPVVQADATEVTNTSGTCGTNLVWNLSDGVLTIGGTGAMESYDSAGAPWNEYCSDINSVVIEYGVTTIGNCAFYCCGSLTSVEISDSITCIGDWAFMGCESLTGIEIPVSVMDIGDRAFDYCTSLTSIEIPNNVTRIGDFAFYWCKSLMNITIPESVTSIGDSAFTMCTSLTSVTIPESVTSIGDSAFTMCTSLTSVTIPNSVTSIGDSVFEWCDSLIIYGCVGSFAEQYANENEISFMAIDKVITESNILDLEACNIASQMIKPNEKVTWTLKFNDGYIPYDLCLEYPNGNVVYISDWELGEDGRYSCSFTVPPIGQSGTYKVINIGFYERDVSEGIHVIYASELGYNLEYDQDLSGLHFDIQYEVEDKEPPVIEQEKTSVTIEGNIIRVFVSAKDELSEIKEIGIGWSYFDKLQNMWQPFECGFSFDNTTFITENGGYVGEENLVEFVTYLREYWIDDTVDTLGIGCINVTDVAGNCARTIILPGYLTFDKEEERIGLDVIPENLRFVIGEDDSEDNSGESTEQTPDNNEHKHSYSSDWTIDVQPTCSQPGSKSHHCTDTTCNSKSDVTQIPAIGSHIYGAWTVTTYATYNHTGTQVRTCNVCGITETGVVPATGYEKGLFFIQGNHMYTVKSINGNIGTVIYDGAEIEKKNITIPTTVKVDGITFTVVEIAAEAFEDSKKLTSVTIPASVSKIRKEAFSGCKKLKKITIKSTKLKSIGKNAIKNINKKATIKVPKSKLAKYKKLFKSKTGFKKTMKIK